MGIIIRTMKEEEVFEHSRWRPRKKNTHYQDLQLYVGVLDAYETKLNSPQLMRCYGMVTLCDNKLLHACIWL